ncbi:hypothetical protein J42TS3_40790 [Paenibacillus vini]|uniref:Uncharacterized protein n=1 Tax=Paenibacillus vini TaxID=1476024 RepID=A0ABQ4MGF8_9BACL|nr:hypothetical protein J42TS3_40790 [Paenibacillus vini]
MKTVPESIIGHLFSKKKAIPEGHASHLSGKPLLPNPKISATDFSAWLARKLEMNFRSS